MESIFRYGDSYSPDGGQTAFPPTVVTEYTRIPHTRPPIPEKPAPPLEFLPKFEGSILAHDEQYLLEGVTPEMLDWFWANMEKGYYLWAPGDHNWFSWITPPNQVGVVGSTHVAMQRFVPGGPLGGVRATRVGMDEYPFTTSYEHVIIENTEVGAADDEGLNRIARAKYVSTYEAVPEGSIWRSNVVIQPSDLAGLRPVGEAALTGDAPENPNESHGIYEVARFTQFLPALYGIWKDMPDPNQNVPSDLRVTRDADGGWVYANLARPTNPQ